MSCEHNWCWRVFDSQGDASTLNPNEASKLDPLLPTAITCTTILPSQHSPVPLVPKWKRQRRTLENADL